MAGSFGSNGWQIVESDSYDESVLECGGYPAVEDAIAWVDFFLNRNPLAIPRLDSDSDIRIIKTKLRIKGGEAIPAYRLFLTVDETSRTVTKLHVSISQPEDMAFGGPWEEYDDPTF